MTVDLKTADLLLQAVKTKPSFPNPKDKYQPTDENLWKLVLEVASGDRLKYERGGREINAPNGSRGFRNMPNNPNGIAWAVKQYNGFGANWKSASQDKIPEKEAWDIRLRRMAAGGVEVTNGPDTVEAQTLASKGLLRLASSVGERHYWDITQTGLRHVRAGLKSDLLKKVKELEALSKAYKEGELVSEQDKTKIADLAKWFRQHFRVDSSKTPRGMKNVKDSANSLLRALELYGTPYGQLQPEAMNFSNSSTWNWLSEHLDELVQHFTAEGDASKGKKEEVVEIKGRHAVYFNRGNISGANFQKYADRLDGIFDKLKGYHKKALTGNLKVAFVGSQQMSVQGKYKESADELWVKATPQVMKRSGNSYGSPEYIIIHELGHRYEKFNRPSENFDSEKWRTTRYSFKDGEAFAELYALSHFDLTGPWDSEKVEKFKKVMTGKKVEAEVQPSKPSTNKSSRVPQQWAD